MRQLSCCVTLVWVAVLAGCPGSLDNPDDFAFVLADAGPASSPGNRDAGGASGSTPPDCVKTILAGCAQGVTCHGDGATPQVVLTGDDVADRLVDQAATSAGLCDGETLIATDGADSLLLTKLTDPPPCGSPMPFGGTALPAADIMCLQEWVTSLGGTP